MRGPHPDPAIASKINRRRPPLDGTRMMLAGTRKVIIRSFRRARTPSTQNHWYVVQCASCDLQHGPEYSSLEDAQEQCMRQASAPCRSVLCGERG